MKHRVYMAAAACILLASPNGGYARNLHGCEINEEQYDEARGLMEKQISIGELLRQRNIQTRADVIKESLGRALCQDLGQGIFRHVEKYGISGAMRPDDPKYCSTNRAQNDALDAKYVRTIHMTPLGPLAGIVARPDRQKMSDATRALRMMAKYCQGDNI